MRNSDAAHRVRAVVAVIAMIVLAGCQTLNKSAPAGTPPDQQGAYVEDPETAFARWRVQRNMTHNWRYSARVALTSGDQNERFNLNWEQVQNQGTLRLFGPMGFGAVRVELAPDRVLVTKGDGTLFRGNDPEALLWETLGVALPVSALRDWVYGLPLDKVPFDRKFSHWGEPEQRIELTQLGWKVEWSDFRIWEQSDGTLRTLPRRISAEGTNAIGDPVRLKLIARNWEGEQPLEQSH